MHNAFVIHEDVLLETQLDDVATLKKFQNYNRSVPVFLHGSPSPSVVNVDDAWLRPIKFYHHKLARVASKEMSISDITESDTSFESQLEGTVMLYKQLKYVVVLRTLAYISPQDMANDKTFSRFRYSFLMLNRKNCSVHMRFRLSAQQRSL